MNDFIIISLFALFIFYVANIYNRVIRKRNEAQKAFGTVEIQLKKRFDLLPNLVEIVKQYAFYEVTVLSEITRINNELSIDTSTNEKVELYNSLEKQAVLLLNIPDHPELKTSDHFLKLEASWNETEEQLMAARRYYNAAVAEYNNSIQTFPANFLIKKASYPEMKFLELSLESENISAGNLFNRSKAQ